MIKAITRIICDTHADGEASLEGEGIAVIDRALALGWRVTTTPSKRTVHLCPECSIARFGRPELTVVPDGAA